MRIVVDARKIAHYGIGTYIRGLLRGLAELRSGDEILAIAPTDARDLVPVEHVVADAPHYSLRELVSIGRIVRRLRADLFHAPHYVLPFTNVPAVVTIHDLIHLRVRHRNPAASIYARAMLSRAVHVSRRVLTVSDAVRHDIEKTFGVTNVSVTPNGIEPRFSPQGPRRPGRYFLYVGNDKPHKNVETLVAAFRMFNTEQRGRREPPYELVLVGSAFERFAGVATRPGFVRDDELPPLYRGATAVVVPSLDEGFGLPAAEAMASGAPVIASNIAALTELTAGSALLADPHDAGSFAAAMRQIASDAQLRESLRSRGYERAKAFTWRRCAELTHAAYREAGSRRNR